MSNKYHFNTSFKPGEMQQAAALEKTREQNRVGPRTTYQIKPNEKQNYYNYEYLNPEYQDRLPEKDQIEIGIEQGIVNEQLNRLGGFTYDIPEEKYWNTRARYIDKDGVATSLDGREKIGKAFVPPEFYEYVEKQMQRDQAEAFKEFVFGQMDITDPVKKAYWERKNPLYFKEMMDGQTEKMKKRFTEEYILLHGPKTEQEYNWLYMNVFPEGKKLYNQYLENNSNIPVDIPTTLPYPQGKINPIRGTRNKYDITRTLL